MNINAMQKEDLVIELESHGIVLHPATGIAKLRKTLQEVIAGTYSGTVKPVNTAKITKPVIVKEKPVTLTKEQNAMRLVRIVVTPNDTLLNSYPGLIFTVGSSDINKGRVIKKFVPFNNENGWHVPYIIYEQIKNAEMQKFKKIKLADGEESHQAYITKKFNVEILPPLTKEELSQLRASQQAMGGM